MFFSSDTKNLPRVGEEVRVIGDSIHDKPYKIVKRKKDKLTGQVFVDFESMPPAKIEPFSFWPAENDTVVFLIKIYLDWLCEQHDIQASAGNYGALAQIQKRMKVYGAGREYGANFGGNVLSLMEPFLLVKTQQGVGAVKGHGELIKAPLYALAVLKKEDGRTTH